MALRDAAALRAFARDFILFPQAADALRVLADLASERGDFAEAAWHYGHVVELRGATDRESLGLLGQALLQFGELDAFSAWCGAHGIDPRAPLRVVLAAIQRTPIGEELVVERRTPAGELEPVGIRVESAASATPRPA